MCLKIKMSIKQDILNVDISYWGWKLCERISATSIIMHHTDESEKWFFDIIIQHHPQFNGDMYTSLHSSSSQIQYA